MPEIQTEFLFTIDLDFEFSVLGETPYGIRRIARLKSGNFDGPKLKGTVLPGGGAWTLVRRDDVLDIEVRLLLRPATSIKSTCTGGHFATYRKTLSIACVAVKPSIPAPTISAPHRISRQAQKSTAG